MNFLLEKSFRQVEHIFDAVVRTYPQTVTVPVPDGIVAETYANRLRKNVRELHQFKWDTRFDIHRFTTIWEEVVVRPNGRQVEIGPRVLNGHAPVPLASQARSNVGLVVEHLDTEIVYHILMLHHKEVLKEATWLKTLQDSTFIEDLIKEKTLNAVVRKHPDAPGYLLF